MTDHPAAGYKRSETWIFRTRASRRRSARAIALAVEWLESRLLLSAENWLGGTSFTNLAGATASAYTFVASVGQTGFKYRAVFTNAVKSVSSAAATLTATTLTAPVVTADPASPTVVAGNSVSLTAAAIGNPVPSVQWQVNANGFWTNIPGATSTTLKISNVPAPPAGELSLGALYRAIFTNSQGSTATAPAQLNILFAPVLYAFGVQEEFTSAGPVVPTLGSTITLVGAANANPSPTASQWQVSTDGGRTFTNLTGETAGSLSVVLKLADSAYLYRVVISNSIGTTISQSDFDVDVIG